MHEPGKKPALPSHPRVVGSVLDLVGDTPLFEIQRLDVDAPRGRVFAKAEQQNPGGSVKDRICLAMIEAAEASGALGPGGVVVEPTSGNTGIGLALVCAAKGYRCVLTMPASMSLERRQLLEAYGAEVILTDAEEQMEGAITKAREIVETTKGAFMPAQFDNPENPRVHGETTAREILQAMANEPIHAFVAGVGTGGTVSGVGELLRRRSPRPRIIAVEPEACATISRGERGPTKIQGLAPGFVPKNYHPEHVDEVRTVGERAAYETKVALARKEGLLVGISAGAAVKVALDVARELGPGANVVTVLCDTGERYFSLDEYFK
ncbi:cysteine synthase A [Polyangium jinanense]|uniref:cysteine synthase n=1 Tax=Polyangium jinanense TaxID=2829994 RepID=A0A9X3X6H3_9BACT|nr:cysteine synthase A [Polyangium jinanense]MDC3962024.1 cysteine synthase A [Polyangium jinanense]MDC3982376.1 cysteine synthase A [Polyangium jinanense]